jgi:ABC-type dipeptide/oligopeptide/nickel transport system permease component
MTTPEDTPPQPPPAGRGLPDTISGTTILVALVAIPVVWFWLILILIISLRILGDISLLENVDSLMLPVASLSLPVGAVLGELFRRWVAEGGVKDNAAGGANGGDK